MALWPDKHLAALRGYLSENGVSFAKATVDLNKEFGTDYSRNSVIGKATREKIPCRNPQHAHGTIKLKKEKPVPVVMVRKRQPQPSTPAETLRSVEVIPRHISFSELTSNTCKWPFGDSAPFTYCGNPVLTGSYCGPHFFLSKRSRE